MQSRKPLVSAIVLSASVGLIAPFAFAQTAPGGTPIGPATPGGVPPSGPTRPQPGQTLPQPARPNAPVQPAPGVLQTDPFPGRPTPGGTPIEPVPGQPAPIPGQPGTIPERLEQPRPTTPPAKPGSSPEMQAPGSGARLDGERRSIIPPEPRTIPNSYQGVTPGTQGGVAR
jgi:hypothetical protein